MPGTPPVHIPNQTLLALGMFILVLGWLTASPSSPRIELVYPLRNCCTVIPSVMNHSPAVVNHWLVTLTHSHMFFRIQTSLQALRHQHSQLKVLWLPVVVSPLAWGIELLPGSSIGLAAIIKGDPRVTHPQALESTIPVS